jgi:hypothetical protein
MEILAVIGIIALISLIFFGGGIIGWILQAMGFIFEKLFEGCQTSFGCLFVVVVFGLLLLGMIL